MTAAHKWCGLFLVCSQELQVDEMLTNIVFPAEVNVQINKAKNKYIVFNILHNNVTHHYIKTQVISFNTGQD